MFRDLVVFFDQKPITRAYNEEFLVKGSRYRLSGLSRFFDEKAYNEDVTRDILVKGSRYRLLSRVTFPPNRYLGNEIKTRSRSLRLLGSTFRDEKNALR